MDDCSVKSEESEEPQSWAGEPVVYAVDNQSLRSKYGGQPHGVGGCFLPGRLSAVLGPADSGKSNFMRVLAGRCTAGGSFVSPSSYTTTIALVESFDTLIPNFTVEKQLLYAADLSNPRSLSSGEKAARVNDVVQMLGLDSVRRSRIGCAWVPGISAEEIRLTSIGVALVSMPAALLLDSPTSGLVPAAGNRVMRVLKALAQRGLTVVAALDAPTPTAYSLLDSVVVLLQGKPIYAGCTGNALVTYFEMHCPTMPAFGSTLLPESEWLLESLEQPDPHTDGSVGAFADAYAVSATAKAAVAEIPSHLSAASPSQPVALSSCHCGGINPAWFNFWVLIKRRTLTNISDPLWICHRSVEKLFFCLLIMSLYWRRAAFLDPASVSNIVSILWMLVLLPLFYGAFMLGFLVSEMSGFLRERNAKWYSTIVYLAHKMSEEILFAALMTLPLSCILFFPMKLHGSWVFFWLVYFVTNVVGLVLAYLLAFVSPTIEVANGLMPLVVISLLFFAGCLLRDVDMPRWWHWFSYLDPLKYAYGDLLINEYGGRLGWDETLVVYNLQSVNKWHYLGYEAIFIAGLFGLLWFALSVKRTAPHYRISIALRCR